MHRGLLSVSLSVLVALLSACEKTGDKTPPQISRVYTQALHVHPSYEEKAGNTANYALYGKFEYRITDPQGVDDINRVVLSNRNNGLEYTFIQRSNGRLILETYDPALNVFGNTIANPQDSTRIDLQNWIMTANDLSLYSTSRRVTFALPDGDMPSTEGFVYTPDYAGDGPGEDGIPAMELMTIADNNLVFTEDTMTQTFRIEFQTTDARAKNYALWFYTLNPGVTPVTIVKHDSPSIASNPIVFGQNTTLTLPWSEIDYDAGVQFLEGVHIVLLDEPVESELVNDRKWFSYVGVSEFVELP